jgi:Sterol-sensing domain of SREBP cleavage-activation
MNGVLAYPPQTPTTIRISNALGDVGHLSLAATCQNLGILWLLYRVVSPGVQAFCIFAAAALIFDFFFHLIFFVAVLSVDVRRVELQDSIERVNENFGRRKRSKAQKRYWLDALLQGQLPFSSRIAFPAVSICFILGLNVQFSDSDSIGRYLLQALVALRGQLKQSLPESLPTFAPSVNQVRTPQTWLRLQNHKTAEEVIKFVKPSAHTIIARIYDPLAIVLKGSDRSTASLRSGSYLFLWQNLNRHMYPFLLTIIFTISVVTLLMQYLLWNEMLDDEEEIVHSRSALATKRLPHAHDLDVLRMAVSGKGHILAVDSSRHTFIYYFKSGSQSWSAVLLPTKGLPIPFWPNRFLAIDDTSTYAAFANSDGWIAIWHMQQRKLIQFHQLSGWNQRPLVCQLVSVDLSTTAKTALVVVLPDGQLTVLNIEDKSQPINTQIADSVEGFLSHAIITQAPNGVFVVVSSLHGLYIIPLLNNNTRILRMSDPRLLDMENDRIKYLTAAPSLSLIVATREHSVDLIDISTRLLIHRLPLSGIAPKSLRILHPVARICRTCQSTAVRSISLAYTEFTTKDCVLKTFTASTNDFNSSICLRPTINVEGTCQSFSVASEINHRVTNPGKWEATHEQIVIGIRHPVSISVSNGNTNKNASFYTTTLSSSRNNSMSTSFLSRNTRELTNPSSSGGGVQSYRSRTSKLAASTTTATTNDPADTWEVWSLSVIGEYDVAQLAMNADTDLFVAEAGPLSPLGRRSLAVALGNSIQVVTAGSDRIEEVQWSDVKGPAKGDGRRRRAVPR